jgi:hypothetical protein
MPVGLILERRWRKRYGVYFLSSWFIEWLRTTWSWEIFVRRCHVGSKTAYILRGIAMFNFLIGGIAFLVCFYQSNFTPPPLDLDQMRVVKGTLENWKRQYPRAKGGCGDTITLRLQDGCDERFFKYPKQSEDYYRQMKGQEWTLWVQPGAYSLLPNCRIYELVNQIEHNGILILKYDKTIFAKAQKVFYGVAKFFSLIGVFFLFMVWLINRRKNTQYSKPQKS